MSNTVDIAFVRQFKDNIYDLARLEGSALLPHLNVEKTNSKIHYFERLGGAEASEIFERHGATPAPVNIAHSRRGAILRSFDVAELLDRQDEVRMLINPQSKYAQALADGLGVKADDVILSALYGNANSYDAAEASSNVALTAGNIIDEDFGTSNADLTVAKLREARRILLVNKVNLKRETPIIFHDGTALMSLLAATEVTSADFNTVKALVNGELNTFMGFKFVHCERLADAQHKTSEGFVRALVVCPRAVGVVTGNDINVRITEESTKRFATQVYASMDIGAVRIEEAPVISIECYRA